MCDKIKGDFVSNQIMQIKNYGSFSNAYIWKVPEAKKPKIALPIKTSVWAGAIAGLPRSLNAARSSSFQVFDPAFSLS